MNSKFTSSQLSSNSFLNFSHSVARKSIDLVVKSAGIAGEIAPLVVKLVEEQALSPEPPLTFSTLFVFSTTGIISLATFSYVADLLVSVVLVN